MAGPQDDSREDLKDQVAETLRQVAALPGLKLPVGVEGAVLRLVPREEGLQPKEVPVGALLGKVVMMREKLRVLEQRLNNADSLSLAEKVDLQGAVTGVYQALASVAALFQPPPGDQGKTS